MLSKLGVAWSLTAAPLISVCLMAATALYPNLVMIGVGEILRKVTRSHVCIGCWLIKRY